MGCVPRCRLDLRTQGRGLTENAGKDVVGAVGPALRPVPVPLRVIRRVPSQVWWVG